MYRDNVYPYPYHLDKDKIDEYKNLWLLTFLMIENK
jgi:hypothetical protein